MPRSFYPGLWFLVSGLACALSVDDPAGGDPLPEPPSFGNPFSSSSFDNQPRGNGGTGGGPARGVDSDPDEAGGRRGDDPDRAGQAGERVRPLDVLVSDAAAPECPGDAGACADALCLSNDDCHAALCVNLRCRPFCAVDEDCPDGQACALGLCRTSPGETWECFAGGDCPTGEDCVSGSCLRRCADDDHCAGSDDGDVCSLGYCGQ